MTWCDSFTIFFSHCCRDIAGGCSHVPEQRLSSGWGGPVESGNMSPGDKVRPAKTHNILTCFLQAELKCRIHVTIIMAKIFLWKCLNSDFLDCLHSFHHQSESWDDYIRKFLNGTFWEYKQLAFFNSRLTCLCRCSESNYRNVPPTYWIARARKGVLLQDLTKGIHYIILLGVNSAIYINWYINIMWCN